MGGFSVVVFMLGMISFSIWLLMLVVSILEFTPILFSLFLFRGDFKSELKDRFFYLVSTWILQLLSIIGLLILALVLPGNDFLNRYSQIFYVISCIVLFIFLIIVYKKRSDLNINTYKIFLLLIQSSLLSVVNILLISIITGIFYSFT